MAGNLDECDGGFDGNIIWLPSVSQPIFFDVINVDPIIEGCLWMGGGEGVMKVSSDDLNENQG